MSPLTRNPTAFSAKLQDRRLALYAMLAAIALMASWVAPVTSDAWQWLDDTFYFAINRTVGLGTPFAEFWALTGDRRFDIVGAVIILVITIAAFMMGGILNFRRAVHMGVCLVLALLVFAAVRQFITYDRLSPSRLLQPHYSIVSYVPWSGAKEFAAGTFPGDHSTVTLIIAWFWWRWGGTKMGLLGLALSFALTAPRFAAGAHWLTDLTVGAAAVALFIAAAIWGTPLGRWFSAFSLLVSNLITKVWIWHLRKFFDRSVPFVPVHTQLLRGICIGTADLIPGVSGGTMALILGIYQRLISAVARVDGTFLGLLLRGRIIEVFRRVDVLFVVPIAVGMLFAIVFFSRIVPVGVMITNLPEVMFGLFFGLISASIISLYRRVEGISLSTPFWLALGFALGLGIVTTVPMDTPDSLPMLFLSGMATSTAMLMPGISGAYVLLLLGKYATAIEAMGRFDWTIIAPLAIGAIVGVLAFSKLISWLLRTYYRPVMLTVTGLLTGTLLAIWPFQQWVYAEIAGKQRLVKSVPYLPQSVDAPVLWGLAMMVVGVLVFFAIERLALRRETATSANA